MGNRKTRQLQQRTKKPDVPTTAKIVTQPQQQGAVMSSEHDKKQKELEEAFNAKKDTPSTDAPQSPDQKKGEDAKAKVVEGGKETKEGVIKVVTGIPSLAWNKVLKPAYEFIKGIVTRAWNGLVNLYNAEVEAFKELGAVKYFLGRIGKAGLKLFKLMAAAGVVAFLNNLLFNATGISFFDPMTLGIIACVALLCVMGSSYYAQKDIGADLKASTFGQHIVEAAIAA